MPTKEPYARNWWFTCDSETLPAKWRETLDKEQTAWIESPLHDKDITTNGDPIKPHLHIIMMYKGARSYSHMKAITDSLDQEAHRVVNDTKCLVRFFVHEDDPGKHHYNRDEIICHGGADSEKYFYISPRAKKRAEKRKNEEILKNIVIYTMENKITNYDDLVRYILDNEKHDWLNVLSTDHGTMLVSALIESIERKQMEI